MNNFYARIRNTYEDNEDQTTSLNVAIHHLVHSIAAFLKEFKDSAISENIFPYRNLQLPSYELNPWQILLVFCISLQPNPE